MNETTDAPAIFAPLWRRKWLILIVALIVGIGTYFYYKRQTPVFSASTQIYLGAGSEEAGLLNAGGATKLLVANSANQTALINSAVSEAVHKKLRQEGDLAAAKGKVHAKAPERSQFIVITAEAHTSRATATLANAVAVAYVARSRVTYLREIGKALTIARRQLQRVEATQRGAGGGKGQSKAAGGSTVVLQAAGLSSKVNQLEAEQSVKGVQQVSPAKANTALLLSPKPRQNAIFGFVLGLFLAAVAAYLLSRFDRRIRSLADVESTLQTRILTALPHVKRTTIERDGVLGPSRPLLEPLRRLHTTLQMGASAEQHAAPERTILFLSADAGDGQSTLIANLARVQRDAGARVAVLECDFRRPVLAGLLRAEATPGLGEVLEGGWSAEQALQTVGAAPAMAPLEDVAPDGSVATVVGAAVQGTLSVLVSGAPVSNPPALLASARMKDLLSQVSEEFDYVLIDAPSPLEVSDVMPLLGLVDGVVIVARLGHTRETSARRLQQLLEITGGAPVIGAVANSAPKSDIEKYGFSAVTGAGRRRRVPLGR